MQTEAHNLLFTLLYSLELRNHILLIKEQKLDTLSTMVNLSSEFFVQAKVEDTSKIFVHVGLGFHPELTLDEALTFIEEKEKLMNECVFHTYFC